MLSQLLTLPLVALLALGLSGQSRLVRHWMDRAQTSSRGWLKQYQIPEQAQSLMVSRINPWQHLSGSVALSGAHPVTLAAAVATAVLCAPLVVQLFGAALGVLVLAAIVGGAVWYVLRRNQQAAAKGGGQ